MIVLFEKQVHLQKDAGAISNIQKLGIVYDKIEYDLRRRLESQ